MVVVPTVREPAMDKLPEDVKLLFPLKKLIKPEPELIKIFPVPFPPMVSVCLFVVANVPSPVMYVAIFPEFAEIDATGVPVFIWRTANLAEAVDCPPTKRSVVAIFATMAPFYRYDG